MSSQTKIDNASCIIERWDTISEGSKFALVINAWNLNVWNVILLCQRMHCVATLVLVIHCRIFVKWIHGMWGGSGFFLSIDEHAVESDEHFGQSMIVDGQEQETTNSIFRIYIWKSCVDTLIHFGECDIQYNKDYQAYNRNYTIQELFSQKCRVIIYYLRSLILSVNICFHTNFYN